MLLVFNHKIHCHFLASADHERNRCGYQKIAFAALNIIHKRVITKVMVEYSEITLQFNCLKTRIYYSEDGEIFFEPAQCYDVCHGLAGHMTKSLFIRTSITQIE
jgi:hypothetical protein